MDVYSYSEARRNLSSVLDKAESTGKVFILRRDGRTYSLAPEQLPTSPLDLPSVKADISTQEVVALIRRERGRGRGVRRSP